MYLNASIIASALELSLAILVASLLKEHTDTSITGEGYNNNHVPPMKSMIPLKGA